MKKLFTLIASALVGTAAICAQGAWLPPEFVESEWTNVGEGSLAPGVMDIFPNEYPGELKATFYSSNVTVGDYWITPHTEDLSIEEYMFPGPFIVHIQDPDKVWTDPIWCMHPLLFCFYHAVPEVYGFKGSAANYGKLSEGVITFPENCYVWETNPQGTPNTNIMGSFEIYMPDPAGVTDLKADTEAPVYHNLQGHEIASPQHGVYIVRQGNSVKKIRK